MAILAPLATPRKAATSTVTADGLLVVRTDYTADAGIARVYYAGAVQETFTGVVTHERALTYAKQYATQYGLALNPLL